MEAQCACGQLVVILTEDVTPAVVACHCTACQRRSGSPFGVGAYYPRALLSFSGDSRRLDPAGRQRRRVHHPFLPGLRLQRLLDHGEAPGRGWHCCRGDCRSTLSSACPVCLGRDPA